MFENIKTTIEYFGLSLDQLLEVKNEYGYTREECKLFDDGEKVIFFNDKQELNAEQEGFNKYIQSNRFEVKATLKTINEKIAVVLI